MLIKDIEKLCPELHLGTLSNVSVFHKGDVCITVATRAEGIAPEVSGMRLHRLAVKVYQRHSKVCLPVADHIRGKILLFRTQPTQVPDWSLQQIRPGGSTIIIVDAVISSPIGRRNREGEAGIGGDDPQ